ncbi:MAG: phage protease [Terriglobia bacterium]
MPDDKNQFHFMSPLSAVPAEGLARIPILVTGSWVKGGREVSFTRDELCTASDNFQKLANHDLNVDYDHACEDLERAAGEPTPSAGRILALDNPEIVSADRQVGSGQVEKPSAHLPTSPSARWILYGRYEPTARARQMIKNREYRYVSAAFAKDYPDRKTGQSQGLTLTSVALTNQPFLDELPEIWLSTGIRDQGLGVREPQSLIPNPQPLDLSRLSAEQGGKMAKLTLKCSAEGTHEAYDGDRKVGEIENDHLYEYATKHAGKEGVVPGNLSARGTGFPSLNAPGQDAYATFAREVGAEGRSKEEIRGLVTLALHPLKAEVTLLSESIGADGKLDNSRLDALDDCGKISRSAWRRAKDAEQRVQNAFNRGQITPAMMATGAPLRLALADGAAFKALIEDRPALLKTNSVVGIGGSGSETGESPRQLFSRLVEEKKQQLMQTDVRLGELEAHRKAGALVAKENPDLLKNYRADAKST